MSGTPPTDIQIDAAVAQILQSRKYRHLDLDENTVRDLLSRELASGLSMKRALKETRRRLHNIIAPYLGDPDYTQAARQLEEAFVQSDDAVRDVCTELLSSHASTHERLPMLEDFFRRLFALTGQPEVLLDLACGMNPLAFPWMGLPCTTRYHAYDLHAPRVGLIQTYFTLQGLQPLAEVCDILLQPPQIEAQVAFFFKEAHRFEQRRRGCNRAFWEALKVRYLLVSLPAQSLSGKHNLLARQRRLVYDTLEGLDWPVHELQLGQEIIFCIDRQNY